MKKNIISLLIIIIAVALYLDFTNDKSLKEVKTETPINTTTQAPVLTEDDYMDISIYIQDKEVAKKSDCRVTTKIEYTIPKTKAVDDAVLKILFADELSKYGVYKSVTVEKDVAKIMLESDMTPEQRPIGSLSSCESGHLLSVLKDTLKLYEPIKSVELYSPNGEIVF